MKRFLFFVLAAAMMAVLLTGCAGSRSSYSYRGNVSTTDDGRVNGTNDNMTGYRPNERRSTYGTELPGNYEPDRTWEDARGRRYNDSVDPNRPGWTSGTGEEDKQNKKFQG